MIDTDKVIRHIAAEIAIAEVCKKGFATVDIDMLSDALALLKEQEPKPIAYTDNPYTGLPVARCPKCGKFARQFHASTDEETHYCPWCGKQVKWDA